MSTRKTPNRWLRVAVATAVLATTGVVFAATQTDLFSIFVETEGKSDQEVADEVHDQLLDDGVSDPEVRFKRRGDGDGNKLAIAGHKGGKHFKVIRKTEGDDGNEGVIEMRPPELDTEREPGMTDEELEAKIQAQLDELGLDGRVKVRGDRIEVRAEKEQRMCGDQECGDDNDE